MKEKLNGFTLAEVLITLAIVGVVAAMTIPTLIAKINNIANDNQSKVFNAKLIKGLNLTKTAGDMNDTYESTYEFLTDGLSKNLKMVKICDSSHIRKCMSYDKIKYDKKNGDEAFIDLNNITPSNLHLDEPYKDLAAFVLADGTPAIVSYNLKCIVDDDKADTTINSCLSGVYDINGTRKPNKYKESIETVNGKDIISFTSDLRAFNDASIGQICIGEICLAHKAVKTGEEMYNLIKAADPNYKMPTVWWGPTAYDYWQLSMDYCSKVGGGSLPTANDTAYIARVLYNNENIALTSAETHYINLNWDANKAAVFAAMGIDPSATSFDLWTRYGQGNEYAIYRHYDRSKTDYWGAYRTNAYYALCVE